MLQARKTLILVVTAVALALWCGSMGLAQQPRRGGPSGGFGGGRFGGFGGSPFGGGASLLDLVSRDDVAAELELVDSQKEQIRALREELSQQRDQQRQQLRDRMSSLRNATDEQRRQLFEQLRGAAESAARDLRGKLEVILLPHQLRRLDQLAVQVQIRRARERALMNGAVAEKLGITDQQRQQLEQKRREAEQAYMNVFLSVLTPAQQSQYQALVGEPFDFQEQSPQPGDAGGRSRNRSAGAAARGPRQGGRSGRRGGPAAP